MRRSNRLVVLVGLFLAVVAFIGVFLLLTGTKTSDQTGRNDVNQVVAAADIPLGTTITQSMLTTKTVPSDQAVAGAYTDVSLVIGQVARKALLTGQLVTSDAFSATSANVVVPPGYRAISIQVDQVTGVGTLIQPGDFVDMVIGLTTQNFPLVTVTRPAGTAGGATGPTTITPVTGFNATSVKVLLQGMQVLNTLLPTPAATPAPGASGAPNAPVLNGQQEIVIVAVPAQYAEVINFAQVEGDKISLILRSSKDCVIPGQASPSPAPSASPTSTLGSSCSTADTTGIVLKTLVDKYGVLIPQVVQAILPSPSP